MLSSRPAPRVAASAAPCSCAAFWRAASSSGASKRITLSCDRRALGGGAEGPAPAAARLARLAKETARLALLAPLRLALLELKPPPPVPCRAATRGVTLDWTLDVPVVMSARKDSGSPPFRRERFVKSLPSSATMTGTG